MFKKIFLIFVVVFYCSCGLIEGDDPECYVEKKHGRLGNHLTLSCVYEQDCSLNVVFGKLDMDSGPLTHRLDYGCISLDEYEYEFVQKKRKKYVNLGTGIDLDIDPDGHVRYSIFDEDDVEKKYDIDLSKVIDSYVVCEDSLHIRLSDYFDEVVVRLKKDSGLGYEFIHVSQSLIGDSVFSVPLDTLFSREFYYNFGLGEQSSLKSDSVYVSGSMYF